jgi:hypothetical protein
VIRKQAGLNGFNVAVLDDPEHGVCAMPAKRNAIAT